MQFLSLRLDGGEYPNKDLKPNRAGILHDRGMNTVYRSKHRHDKSRTKTLCGLKKKQSKTKNARGSEYREIDVNTA